MQAGFLAESLFRVFDEDNSGALSFYEFAQVLFNTNMTKTIIRLTQQYHMLAAPQAPKTAVLMTETLFHTNRTLIR